MPPDHLTHLPCEILHHILDLASLTQRQQTALGLVSKAFLPFARTRTFAVVEVEGSLQLSKFVETIEKSKGAGVYVKCLIASFEAAPSSGLEDDGTTATHSVLTLFTRLPKLEQLSLTGSTRLAKAVLSDSKTTRLFPSLRTLCLDDSFDGWTQPFDPSHFVNVARHVKLSTLELTVDRWSTSFGRYRAPKELKTLESRLPWDLRLTGSLLGNAAAEDLLRSFPSVSQLSLTEQEAEHVDSLSSFLSKLLRALDLRTLSLCLPSPPDTFTQLARSLKAFTALESLHFGPNSFNSSLVQAALSFKNLTKLSFQHGSALSGADLKLLLGSPPAAAAKGKGKGKGKGKSKAKANAKPLPALKLIFLDDVQLSNELTKEEVEEAMEVAEERGVQVEGGVVDFVREKRERAKMLNGGGR
jgi:hypothetical protein